ncbi:MAG: hypothetical protein COU31_01760 [Candidatus Magasanikbacteria bacterium CG10_big_fil_rev_8_21_14_0_10_40_10]|uniref:DUF948 domain-containing protein n=1 Tax=Candidatus Magasanikbacteria bacterium CG10_big_fil_rev_8_21_14_0_10_40_10 TaxID=1974648 RepID=A0A2M6W4G0_9BACT|nr:MAG: hypothetical protein COU31_01760 [Candidatus Magasanikbacteria bacterium CG10_big_fil_rev_8_21_14_0_10_40_10]
MILETSKDILYLVIAFCVLWLTVFLCWMFYYLARLLRNASQIIEEFRVKLQTLNEAVNHVRGRVEQISSLMSLATGGIGGLIKKTISNQAKKMVDRSTGAANKAAKDAVDKAIKSTAKSMKRASKKMKK